MNRILTAIGMGEETRLMLMNVLGISLPSGAAFISMVQKGMPLIQLLALVVSICVGISAYRLNKQKTRTFKNIDKNS